ncbi:DUF5677 domain-containing protein [Streptomyces sp. NPDC102365]|uniref:DUF5677 domain-containing protein n=1 Tax=Streptomyces sp. NPDC102365 TaxID=3366162 RepID=UPI0037FA615D
MAQNKRRKPKKDRRKSGATGSRNPQAHLVRSPKTALKPLLALMREVAVTGERTLWATPDPTDRMVRFDTQILLRGTNSVKAVGVLLENGYWEHAVGVVRQLFELLVNMEYLAKQESRLDGMLLFARYGMLQMILAQHRRMSYDKDTGRPIDDEFFTQLEWHMQNDFTDFRANTKDGSVKWVSSWCRRTTFDLAAASSDPMRKHQYNILYRVWSEEAHAAPGALISNIFQDSDDDDWVEKTVAENEHRSRDAGIFAVTFFLALWVQLPHIESSVTQIQGWLQALSDMHGGPQLPLPPKAAV